MSKKPIDLILKRVFQWFCKSVSLQNASWFIWNDSKLRISINSMQIIFEPLNLKAVWKPLSAVLSALSFVRSCILWRHWMVSSFSVTWECIEGRSLRGTSAGNSLASGSGVCERVRCIDVGVSVRLCMKWTDGGYCFALASKKKLLFGWFNGFIELGGWGGAENMRRKTKCYWWGRSFYLLSVSFSVPALAFLFGHLLHDLWGRFIWV